MNGAFHPFRVLKKKQSGIMYVAIPDLLQYFEERRNEVASTGEEALMTDIIEKFQHMIYEGLDHDL